MSMSSRGRVLAAINHQEPDRVPVDLGGTRATGINISAYVRLRDALGIDGPPPKVLDVWQMLAWVERSVIDRLQTDVLPVPRLVQDFGMRLDSWRTWQLEDGTPVRMPGTFDPVPCPDGSVSLYLDGELVARKVPSSPYFDAVIEMRMLTTPPPVEEIPLPLFSDEDLEWRRHWSRTLRAETDKALLGGFGLNLGRWGSYQEWFYGLGADRDYVRAWYDRKIENMLANMALYAQAVGDAIDIVWLMEDFGTQQGMMISPELFRTLIAPYYKRLFAWVHEHTSWKVFFHSCGGVYPIIEALIDCGVDILNPVQTNAAGMAPGRLKTEFGERVTFWGGGIETQSVLPFGTVEEVRQQVADRIAVFAPGGGFIFTPVHNIQRDVPPENLVAMYEAVHEFGRYPIEESKE